LTRLAKTQLTKSLPLKATGGIYPSSFGESLTARTRYPFFRMRTAVLGRKMETEQEGGSVGILLAFAPFIVFAVIDRLIGPTGGWSEALSLPSRCWREIG
jgi:hypothetical protein